MELIGCAAELRKFMGGNSNGTLVSSISLRPGSDDDDRGFCIALGGKRRFLPGSAAGSRIK
jgi:hypothetical protein